MHFIHILMKPHLEEENKKSVRQWLIVSKLHDTHANLFNLCFVFQITRLFPEQLPVFCRVVYCRMSGSTESGEIRRVLQSSYARQRRWRASDSKRNWKNRRPYTWSWYCFWLHVWGKLNFWHFLAIFNIYWVMEIFHHYHFLCLTEIFMFWIHVRLLLPISKAFSKLFQTVQRISA